MTKETIEELRKIKEVMIGYDDFTQDDLYTIDKAVIMCEQLRKARKKAKRWKRKYLELREQVEKNMKLEALYDRLMAEKGEPNERPTN